MSRKDWLAGGAPAHPDSSASRTCIESASAVEWIATVAMPISLQARLTRRAISPRFAIRTFSNIADQPELDMRCDSLLDQHQGLAKFDRLRIMDVDFRDPAGSRRGH